ncbi:MAG: enoyl-CoA hydratase/isomerase family protein, partial [Pseudooceanicola atlanticus]
MYVTRSDPAPGVAQLTLDRPDRMNALSMDLARDLLDALEGVAADHGIGAVILTGAGRGFCAGGDVKEMERNRDKTLAQRRDDLALMHRIPARLAAMPQVVIAAVNGASYGAGFAVALSCDIVLAAQGARFGTAFLKQGLVSDFGLSYQLTRLAGPAQARQIIFT